MNPLLLAGAALAFMLLGGKKAKATSEPAIRADAPPVRLVPTQDEDPSEPPAPTPARPATRVTLGPAVIKEPAPAPSAPLRVTNADTGLAVTKDAATAKKNAQSVADHVRQRQYNYSRPLVAAWQAMAGLQSDGVYGPATVKALSGYGAKNVNKALFQGAKKK